MVRRKNLEHSRQANHATEGPTINNPLTIRRAAESKRLERNRAKELKVDKSLSCRSRSCNTRTFLALVGAVTPIMPFISIVITCAFDRGRFLGVWCRGCFGAFGMGLIFLGSKGFRHTRRRLGIMFFLIKDHWYELLPSDGAQATRNDKRGIEGREPRICNHMTEESDGHIFQGDFFVGMKDIGLVVLHFVDVFADGSRCCCNRLH